MQSWRNALQNQLGQTVNVLGVTYARFVVACPIALIYLVTLQQYEPQTLPRPTSLFWLFTCGAAMMQILATGLMVVLFKQKNFAVGAGLAKSEALIAAILGVLFFGTLLSLYAWAGVALGAFGVLLLSASGKWHQINIKTLIIGLGSGTAFALTSLWIREASHHSLLPFPHSAAFVLFCVLSLQTLAMTIYLSLFSPQTFTQLWQHRSMTGLVSLFSCLGSIGWFSAMSLQSVPHVKTLGQVEVFFTLAIATYWLKQSVSIKDGLGLILVAVAAIMVMW